MMKKMLVLMLVCSFVLSLFFPLTLTINAVDCEEETYFEQGPISQQESLVSQGEGGVSFDGELPSNYVISEKRFSLDENILVTYKVNFDTTWDAVEYETQGFEILSITMDEEEMTASIVLDIVPEMEEACLVVSNEQNTNKLYGLKTERGYFISAESRDNLWDTYFYSGVEDGLYTMEEYVDLMNNYYGETVFSKPVNNQIANEIIAGSQNNFQPTALPKTQYSGRFSWMDDDGNVFPLQFVKVEVYDNSNSSSPSLLFTTYTNNSGRFNISRPQLFATSYKAVVYSQGERITVANSNGIKYSSETVINEVLSQTSVSFYLTVDMSTLSGQALQISQAVLCADRYAKQMNGTALSSVTVCYPCPDKDTCCYSPNDKEIHILPKECNDGLSNIELETYSSWDVLMHEYGHHVMHEFDIHGMGGSHTFLEDLSTRNDLTKARAIGIAWGEGYASIFCEMAQQYYFPSTQDILPNNNYMSDFAFDSYDGLHYHYESYRNYGGNENSEENPYYGEACEGAIASLLWDLYDTYYLAETFDGISLTHQEFWNIITKKVSNGDMYSFSTFSEFAYYFLQINPTLADSFLILLGYYRMSPDELTWSENNDGSARVTWRKNGSSGYPHSDFTIVFYTLENDVIFGVQVGRYQNYHELSISQLNTLKQYSEIYFVVIGNEYSTPATGPYQSTPYYVTFS